MLPCEKPGSRGERIYIESSLQHADKVGGAIVPDWAGRVVVGVESHHKNGNLKDTRGDST